MPRIRTLKPELWSSPQVMNLSHSARLLFIGLITQADDEGRGSADPRKLKATIFGGDDEVTTARVTELLVDISVEKLCITYETESKEKLYFLPSWRSHQYIQRPKKSAYPAPCVPITKQARISQGSVTDESVTHHGGSDLKDRNGKDLIRSARAREGAHRAQNGSAPAPTEAERLESIERRRREAAALAEQAGKPA